MSANGATAYAPLSVVNDLADRLNGFEVDRDRWVGGIAIRLRDLEKSSNQIHKKLERLLVMAEANEQRAMRIEKKMDAVLNGQVSAGKWAAAAEDD